MTVEWIHVSITVRVSIWFTTIVANVHRVSLVGTVNTIYENVMTVSAVILARATWDLMGMHNAIVIKSTQVFSVKHVSRLIRSSYSLESPLTLLGVHPCFPNPCANGGTCVARGNKVACLCRNKFTGNQCEKRLDVWNSLFLFLFFLHENKHDVVCPLISTTSARTK